MSFVLDLSDAWSQLPEIGRALKSIEPKAKAFTDELVINKKTSLRGVCILTLNYAWAQLFGHHSLTHVAAANHVSGRSGTNATQWTTCLNITQGTLLC